MRSRDDLEVSRRELLIGAAASVAVTAAPSVADAQAPAANAQAAVVEAPAVLKVSFTVNGTGPRARARYPDHPARRAARAPASHRHQEGLRPRPVRRLHGDRRRAADQFLPDARGDARGRQHHHHRGAGHAGATCIRCRPPSSSTTATSAATARPGRSARPWRCSTRSRRASRAMSAPT